MARRHTRLFVVKLTAAELSAINGQLPIFCGSPALANASEKIADAEARARIATEPKRQST